MNRCSWQVVFLVVFLLLNKGLSFQTPSPQGGVPSWAPSLIETMRKNDDIIISSTILRQRARWSKTTIKPLDFTSSATANAPTTDFVRTITDAVSFNRYRIQKVKLADNNILLVITGTFMAFALLYCIAMVDETISLNSWSEFTESVEIAYQNTYDAIAPLGISDVASVIVGESTAAVVAAFASSLILLSWKLRTILPESISKSGSSVVADGDFLVTKAASLSLLTSIGIPPTVAKVASSVLATLPYGIVKLGVSRRDQIVEEDRIMDELLVEQLKREETNRMQNGIVASVIPGPSSISDKVEIADTDRFVPAVEKKEPVLDFVEVFSDIVKWLQYDVLCNHFGETLTWHGQPVPPGFDAALFGAISCLSAQIYCDTLRTAFNLGGIEKRDEVLERPIPEWISLYISQTLYGAALFVSYEAFQIPAQWMLNAILSGGVDNCIGSPDYGGCVETFIELNPPEDSPEDVVYSRLSQTVDSVKAYLIANGFPLS